MTVLEIIMMSLGLAMDAFAAAICKGLALSNLKIHHYIIIGVWFGGFQALMPIIGFFIGTTFSQYISSVDNFVASGLLCIIGINMIRGALKNKEENSTSSISFAPMLFLALATSIDALALGVSLALYEANILSTALIIGGVTFILSALGVYLGNCFGMLYKQKAEIFGGSVLIILAFKMLMEEFM